MNACSRSTFWSEITPVASPPATRGTKRTDFDGSPLITFGLPYRCDSATTFSMIISGSRVSITCLRKPNGSIASSG